MKAEATYKPGDKVRFVPVDEYLGGPVQEGHWKKHGRGPYEVEEVEPVVDPTPGRYTPDSVVRMVGHSQYVTINGETYSGYWLEPA